MTQSLIFQDENKYKFLNTNRKFSPQEVCLDGQHSSLCSQTTYVFQVFDSDLLFMSYHNIHVTRYNNYITISMYHGSTLKEFTPYGAVYMGYQHLHRLLCICYISRFTL